MSVIAEFTVSAAAFALARTFEAIPEVRIEIERLAAHSREWTMPFLWATDDDLDAIERALRADPDVDDLERLDAEDGVGQFKVVWSERIQSLVDRIVDGHGIMQEAEAVGGTWYLKLKFVDREAVGDFQEYFREQDHRFELRRLYDGTASIEREYDLTPGQREVLVVALNRGYFSVPREAQIGDLADELGISTNAVSQRLRRATENLTRNTLTVAPPEKMPDSG